MSRLQKDILDQMKLIIYLVIIQKPIKKLGWKPSTSFDDLVKMMVESDLLLAEREKVLIDKKL